MPCTRKITILLTQYPTAMASVLQRGRVIRAEKQSLLYLPKDFPRLPGAKMIFRGDLAGVSRNYGLA